MDASAGIGALVQRMEGLLAPLEASGDPARFFLATYLRTTRAVAEELAGGGFRDRADLPPLRHVLLGMNAHINYDLAQSLLAVISEPEFDDPALVADRRADHERIDQVLVARVGAEDTELEALSGSRSRTDRLLQPLNRLATRRFLRESRAKVWANTRLLDTARRAGPAAYRARLAELEQLAAARSPEAQGTRQA